MSSQPKPAPQYTEYHPRWYRARVSTWWWMARPAYLKFVLREISSVFVGLFVVLTLAQLIALRRGPEAYAELQRWQRSPAGIAISAIILFFVIWHAITWFNLAPRAMVLRIGGKRVPDALIIALNYGAWLAASIFIIWVVRRA